MTRALCLGASLELAWSLICFSGPRNGDCNCSAVLKRFHIFSQIAHVYRTGLVRVLAET